MAGLADPLVGLFDLGRALGIQPARLRRMQGAGHIPRPASGRTTLVAALSGILGATAAETRDRAPYTNPARPDPAGFVSRDELAGALDAVSAAAILALRRNGHVAATEAISRVCDLRRQFFSAPKKEEK